MQCVTGTGRDAGAAAGAAMEIDPGRFTAEAIGAGSDKSQGVDGAGGNTPPAAGTVPFNLKGRRDHFPLRK